MVSFNIIIIAFVLIDCLREKVMMYLPEVCTTQQAAAILGVSVTTVQNLVEAGLISAWKTKGGHRRIPLSVVQAYQRAQVATTRLPLGIPTNTAAALGVSILVVEKDLSQRTRYRERIGHHDLPLNLSFCENGYQALIEVATRQPDILILDTTADSHAAINTIASYPQLARMHIALYSSVHSANDEAAEFAQHGIVMLKKPINYDELSGFLRTCCAQILRRAPT